MKNIQFQKNLQNYPDNIDVFVDTRFGWNTPSNEGYTDPYIHTQYDEGGELTGIEISSEEYPIMNIETIQYIVNIIKSTNSMDPYKILETFNRLYN